MMGINSAGAMNSQNKRFNMRVGSLNNAINNTFGSSGANLNDSSLSSGPSGGIIGSGMGKNGNPMSQRDKGSMMKDQQIISKYSK